MIRLRVVGSLAALLLTAPVTVWAQGAKPPADEVVARVAGQDVRLSEVEAYLRSLTPETRRQLADNREALGRAVRTYLQSLAIYNEAKAKGWDKRPEVQVRADLAAKEVVARAFLDSVSEPPKDFPSEADLKAAYEQNRASLMAPRGYQLAQIYLPVEPGADKAAEDKVRQQAADLAKKAQARGADFAALAREFSQHAESAAKGGDMGMVAETQLLPEVRDAVSGLAKGGISSPIRSATGYHILRLVDTRPSAVRPFEDVREDLRQALRERAREEAVRRYLADRLSTSPPTVNELALTKALEGMK